ncbi:MAG: type II toxin-antitoxin system RelE/ParE family toxin [Deltaproteobacteria bacterium]|nr:type II toxin-antitoxin system RelE/ParE family toxin [Deltaproteobacteria bacterium]MBI3076637.1 type II toxin-antitoxin system RelE/ParE family toxin [Deltaproteobacteria bacterium]
MAYQVTILPAALRQLTDLPKPDQKRVRDHIDRLATNPRPPGAKPLRSTHGLIRLRVGDYRIIYRIEEAFLVVLVVKIRHRREVYRRL